MSRYESIGKQRAIAGYVLLGISFVLLVPFVAYSGVPTISSNLAADFDVWSFCPSSPVRLHCWLNWKFTVNTSCDHVLSEVLHRVNSQPKKWQDPHNNGTYMLLGKKANELQLSRLTGDLAYTDKLAIQTENVDHGCLVRSCSRSQVYSIGDKGTNYCNVRNLLCGRYSDPPCEIVHDSIGVIDNEELYSSLGAGSDSGICSSPSSQG